MSSFKYSFANTELRSGSKNFYQGDPKSVGLCNKFAFVFTSAIYSPIQN